MPALDPWTDAQSLAELLARADGELLVVIGAEGWCEKCARLRPAFEALCHASMPSHVAWLWMDLEDHTDFLGDFIPPDLPLLLRWQDGHCIQAAIVEEIAVDRPAAERVRLRPLVIEDGMILDDSMQGNVPLPPLWAEFTGGAWAQA